LKADRQIYQTHQLCFHDRQLNSDGHLVCHLVRHPELRLVRPHRRNRHLHLHLHLPDEVHQILRDRRLDDLQLDDLVHLDHQNHRDDLGHLDAVRQNHRDRRLDDHQLDDLGHLDEHLLVEARQLHRHLDAVRHCRMKMDCYLRAEVAARK
jgi:hypothetical protein